MSEHKAVSTSGSTLFLVYDLESTGFDTCKDKIVQICILVLLKTTESAPSRAKFEQLLEFSSYVNPSDKRMSRGAAKVTGLTTTGPKGKLLRSAPFFKQVWMKGFLPQYRAATKHLDVKEVFLTGHNSKRYDDLLLLSETRYSGIAIRACLRTNNVKCVDTLTLAKQLQKQIGRKSLPRVNLGQLYQYFTGDKLKGAHDALADCRATLLILDKLWDGNKTLDYVTLQSQEKVLIKKRTEKGLVTKIKFFGRKRQQVHQNGTMGSLTSHKESIVKCTSCGCMRSTYFSQCTHAPALVH